MNKIAKEAVNLGLAFAIVGAGLNSMSAIITYFGSNSEASNLSFACKHVDDVIGKVLFCSVVPGEKLGKAVLKLVAE